MNRFFLSVKVGLFLRFILPINQEIRVYIQRNTNKCSVYIEIRLKKCYNFWRVLIREGKIYGL